PPPPPTETQPTETPPVASALKLKCRGDVSEEFTGMLEPALAEAPITITYKYTPIGSVKTEELVDTVHTAPDGSFKDKGPPFSAKPGEATASWPGASGYLGATSPTCTFTS